MRDLVSVILPCYNGARWIDRAIKSVLSQTYTNFELIIIDDGSTDNSIQNIGRYIYDSRIRCLSQKNIGFTASINRGINESKGTLLSFIGQDDIWLPSKLELEIDCMNKQGAVGIVHSNFYFMDANEQILRLARRKSLIFSSKVEATKALFINNYIGFETVLVKKSCLDKVGLFDNRMVAFSDHDLWLRIAGNFDIAFLNVATVKKRLHQTQLSNNNLAALKDEFLLTKKAIGYYPHLRKQESTKLSILFYSWGITLLEEGNYDEAKQKFLEVIKRKPWQLKAICAYFLPRLYLVLWSKLLSYTPENRANSLNLKPSKRFVSTGS